MTNDIVSDTLRLEKAYKALQTIKAKLADTEAALKNQEKTRLEEPIAIVGIACRLPGDIDSPTSFWDFLKQGKSAITNIPEERWDNNIYFDANPQAENKMYCQRGGFIKDVAAFDPLFFNISPKEAEFMDPQQRIFLEECWKAFEDAGLTRQELLGQKCGVYAGVTHYDYYEMLNQTLHAADAYELIGNYGSILSARIAYFLNLKGASVAVDTACSSSLFAVHMACKSIQDGQLDMALAGGISLDLSPRTFILMCKSMMLSPEGECKTFDNDANGFVPAEGAGVVVLKRHSQAIKDGNHIYAVIKGSGSNQDGRSNGITAPNVFAQETLETEIYQYHDIHPESIGYIEAHGTGTKLGDPIEIEALTNAFRRYTEKKQYCAIGSVKTNIGHTQSTAGIAGLIKATLCLKNKTLLPSLNLRKENKHIDFSTSPFYVNTELKEWEILNDEPRRAAISSFGFSGTNVHMVLEEHIPSGELTQEASIILNGSNPKIIPISAKSAARLNVYAEKMLVYFRSIGSETPLNFTDLAYTLQVGREAMEYRVAFLAKDIAELRDKLGIFIRGEGKIENCFQGLVNKKKETINFLSSNEEFKEAIDKLLARKKVYQLAELWAKGLDLDWNLLYGEQKPKRISLPTYPFAKERYWIISDQLTVISKQSKHVGKLHPLVHENTSDFEEQRFSSTFMGQEFFLADHVVKGYKILPGVAYLEMARAAVEEATSRTSSLHSKLRPNTAGQVGIKLKNVVWARPITVGEHAQEVHIGLFPEENGQIQYEIYTARPTAWEFAIHPPQTGKNSKVQSSKSDLDEEFIIHSQGVAILSTSSGTPSSSFSDDLTSHEAVVPTEGRRHALDLKALQEACNQSRLSSAQCYDAYKAMGMDYGPSHQGIKEVYVGEGQVLARLFLPSCVADTQDQFILHPSLMDAALQAAVGLVADMSDLKPALPFALEELEVCRSCTSHMWVWARYKNGSSPEDNVQKLDLDLGDERGNVCVRMRGFSYRVFDGDIGSVVSSRGVGTLMFRPHWQEQGIGKVAITPAYAKHLVVLCELGEECRERIKAKMSEARCLHLQHKHKGVDKRFQTYAAQVFEKIQTILKEKPKGKVLIQIVIPSHLEQRLFCGLSGLLKTLRLENPEMLGQLIEVEDEKGLSNKLDENSRRPENAHIRYRGGKRMVASWETVRTAQEDVSLPWKEGGIYLITGGAGGLGLIFANEIASKTKNVTLILTGRSTLSQEKQAELKEVASLGARLEYKQIDVTGKKAVAGLIQDIQKDFGRLDGIIHSAGVIQDNFILKKTKKELQEVLEPKVTGLVNLDEAAKDLPLDFFILFSAVAGVIGNPGQADYTMANAFMDAYAKFRNDLVAIKKRHGQTLSINWPLWKEGGMRVDEATETMMRENTGMIAMKTSAGIQALYQALAFGKSQVMVMAGNLKNIQAFLSQKTLEREVSLPKTTASNALPVSICRKELEEKALHYFKKQLSSILKLPPHRIQDEEPLEKYGIDSIMVMQLTNQLEKTFGSLSKTLFFEYQTIKEATGYFLETHEEKLREILNIEEAKVRVNSAVPEGDIVEKEGSKRKPYRPRFESISRSPLEKRASKVLDIAIIGLSGRYPQARDLQAYWENLREGKDCITEVPGDRWDWRAYYNEASDQAGGHTSKWGGFMDDVDKFDPLFFNISPREAEFMDPQERLFLEHVWMALEDAGYCRETLRGEHGEYLSSQVGVYAGVMYGEYQLFGAEESLRGNSLALAGSFASIANRISYVLDLHGPSMTVDTMCSSSLTCLHLACQDLKFGRTDMGLAGGVNVTIHPNKYLMLSRGQFLSTRGHCESFGEGGDGYIPGEGVGVALLKRLADAERDGDHIYGVIKGSAVNHGGKTNGYTVPNPNAQQMVVARALKESQINPRTISYIEAHGTGTKLGDPIEISGLTKAFGITSADNQNCWLGSAKSNIGHCESAAGIAGITKVLLQMQHGQLVPSLHSKTLNPNIDFTTTPFVVNQKLRDWDRPVIDGKAAPRIAGISSFGAGGSNAHVIIKEHVAQPQVTGQKLVVSSDQSQGNGDQLSVSSEKLGVSSKQLLGDNEKEVQNPKSKIQNLKSHLIVLSARNEDRLREYAKKLCDFVKNFQISNHKSQIINLNDFAYTLQVGREAMEERLGLIVRSGEELEEKLKGFLEGRDDVNDLYRGQVKRNRDTLAVFAADEDLQKAIDAWISKGKYAKLLDLWVKGLIIDWNKLYGQARPRRVSLPTYPFARERYWISNAGKQQFRSTSDVPSIERSIRYLQKQWEQEPRPPMLQHSSGQKIAILATEETRGLARSLAEEFSRAQIIDLHDLKALFLQPWEEYNGCVDLMGCGKNRYESLDWIVWLQKLIEQRDKEGLMLLCVTQGLEAYQNQSINLSGASRVGLYRMLQSEYAHLQSRHMDADPATGEGDLVKQIAREFLLDDETSEICYRQGKRYQAHLVERQMAKNGSGTFIFPEKEVLWITGGTRGLGLLCAQHFVAHYGVKRLVLTGRKALPPHDQWSAYADQDNAVAQKIGAIRALEDQGVEVRVLSMSLTNELAVGQCLEEIKKNMGLVGGVIHCAGMVNSENPAFIRKPVDDIQRILDPKVTGLDILLSRFHKEPLHFFVLFSSVSAIIPSLASGQSDYAMANAYMDYVAEAQVNGCPLISIQWPNWKETGMGEVTSNVYQQTGLLSLTNPEGLQLLDHILSHKMGPVILPSVVNPELWKPEQLMKRKLQEPVFSPAASPRPIMPAPSKTSNDLVKTVQNWLIELVSQALKINPETLEIDTPFQDYGADSVLLAQLLQKINQKFPEPLDPSILLEYSTLESLARWLAFTHASCLSEALGVRIEDPIEPSREEDRLPFSFPVESHQTAGSSDSSDIAVVGMSCRFPGANNLKEYWQLLLKGHSAISPVPWERWANSNPYYAGLIDTITHFDPAFFLISKEDAKAMDPQALLVLEESLKVFCHAGYSLREVKGAATGVYLGARSHHRPEESDFQQARNPIVTVGQNYLASNISQYFDLHGPSLVVDTACSSALVGMNLAIQALKSGEIDSALVGGVNLLTSDEAHCMFQKRNLLSQEPSFHIFDQRASGVVLGEGAGLVFLKTLKQAQRDRDTIYAVIKALAVNNDGRTAGPATPNIQSLKDVMRRALVQSGKRPEDIRYIEANGSGSEVTDLLELKAVESAYCSSNKGAHDLGSVKPNIGHLLCAEGIAGFIKLALMLQHQQWVPFLSGEEPMTHYNIDSSPFSFCRTAAAWTETPRIAALNCFADGGTNAHLILESWENVDAKDERRQPLSPPQLNRIELFARQPAFTEKQDVEDIGQAACPWWGSGALFDEQKNLVNV